MAVKHWQGKPPDKCDVCGTPVPDVFIDGKTVMGPWGILCIPCHAKVGVGLGTGLGQKYSRTIDGNFLKIAG